MGLVHKTEEPPSIEAAQRWSVWAVRLLIVVLALQAALVFLHFSGGHALAWGPTVEVTPAAGAGRPSVPHSVDVRSYTRFYVDDRQIPYSPEDLTDAVEYAVNYLAEHPRSQIRIVRTTTVRRPQR
jgi:hypothetical protein